MTPTVVGHPMIVPVSYRALDLNTEAAKSRYWNAYERMRTRWYGAASIMVKRRFADESRSVVNAILASGQGDTFMSAYRAVDAQREAWEKLLQAVYVSVGEQFAPTVGDTLNPGPKSYRPARNYATSRNPLDSKGVFTDVWMSFILNYLKTQSSTKITQISGTTRELIRYSLAAGIERGETLQKLADRVQSSYSEMTPYRAEMIARTEVINASNAASVAGARASGAAVMKQWLACRDSRVRKDHEEADGQTVPLDQPFTVGGYQLQWPGDPSLGAPAKEVVNCRCAVIYVRA